MKKTQHGDYAMWLTFNVLARYQVRIIFSNDVRKSAIKRIGHDPIDKDADAFVYHLRDTGMSYIFLPLDTTEHMVAHEAWHIVFRMFHYVHVQDMDDEMVAYHLGHLVEKIYEFKNKIQKQEVLNDPRTVPAKTSEG